MSQLGGTVLFVLQIAATKLTKPVWLIILGAAVLLIPRTDHPKWERIKTDGYDVATLLPLERVPPSAFPGVRGLGAMAPTALDP